MIRRKVTKNILEIPEDPLDLLLEPAEGAVPRPAADLEHLSEFRDVVFDNNRFGIDLTVTTIDNRVTKQFLSYTTSSNTTSLNSRAFVVSGVHAQRRVLHARSPFN